MTLLSRRGAGLTLAAALILAAAGCAKLLTEAPRQLYRVATPPPTSFPPRLPHVPGQLLVEVPTAPSALDTERIALSRSPVTLDYFADAQWTDRAPIVVQSALVEAFENSGGIVAIDREVAELRADFTLRTEIRRFEGEYAAPNKPPVVHVVINARLVDTSNRTIIAQKSFSQDAPAAANDVPHVVIAFDEALGGVMRDIVVWTLNTPAVSRRPAPLPAR